MRVEYIPEDTVLEIIRTHPDIMAHQITVIGYPALREGSAEFRSARYKTYNQLQRLKNAGRIYPSHTGSGAYRWRAAE